MEYKKYFFSHRGRLFSIFYLLIIEIMVINVSFSPGFVKENLTGSFFLSYYPEITLKYMILLVWFLPVWIYQILIYITQNEFVTKYYNIPISKRGIKAYYLTKVKNSFLIIFSVMFLICLISIASTYLLAIITHIPLKIEAVSMSKFELTYPLVSLIGHYLIFAFCAGLLATVLNALTFLFKDMKVTLASSMLFWYFFISSSNFNTMILFQPFILNEYSINYKVGAFTFYCLVAIIINILSYIIILNKDNI